MRELLGWDVTGKILNITKRVCIGLITLTIAWKLDIPQIINYRFARLFTTRQKVHDVYLRLNSVYMFGDFFWVQFHNKSWVVN